jgi:hypothetical protein
MKRLLLLILTLATVQFAYATETANIKIKVSGPIKDNSYFLCVPDLGCLSILAAKKGKVFPVNHDVDMNTVFVTDVNTMRVYNQGLPKSCDVSVKTNQTITIYGNLASRGDKVKINQLRCVVS